jgi:hypothetical protein
MIMIYSNKHGDDDVLEIPPKLMEPPYSGFISITRTSRTALPRRIHGYIWCAMDPINIPPRNVSIYIPTMDEMGDNLKVG